MRVSKTAGGQPRNFGKLDQELEVYLPIRAQREKYNGDDELLVAWQLQEDEAPVAYTSAGERVLLSLDQPPVQPTLVIVPREDADMDQVVLDPGCANHASVSGAVGTWACSPTAIRARAARLGPIAPAAKASTAGTPASLVVPTPDDPPPPGGTMPAAFYMESTFMWDLREPWPLGSPEIVYLITTVPTFGNLNDTQVACLSEAPSPTGKFYLNQDNVQQTYPMNPYDVKATT